MLLSPWLIALGLVLALLVLFPARRLQLAGLSSRAIGAYVTVLWLIGFLLAIRPAGFARFLVPIVLLAYIAPFVAAPERVERVGRWLGRGRPPDPPRPPMKDVTPRDDQP